MERAGSGQSLRHLMVGSVSTVLMWVLYICELLTFVHVTPGAALPVSQPQLHNLDLRMVEYTDSDGPQGLSDGLVLEFKSENLSGVVRLERLQEGSPSELAAQRRKEKHHGKKNNQKLPYDQKGAMYFAVSVVSLYGLSIGVLVAFSLRKDWDEDEVKNFQRSWLKMDHQMEKQEKQRAKRLMARAIIAIHQPRRGSVCAAVTRDTVYMALAPMALSTPSSDRRPSRESIIWNNLPPPMVTIEEGGGNGPGGEGGEESGSGGARTSTSTHTQDEVAPGPSGYVQDINGNSESIDYPDYPTREESVDNTDTDDVLDDLPAEDSENPSVILDIEEEVQFVEEEYLLEGQLEEDLILGSDALSPVVLDYVHLDPGCASPRVESLRGSRGHDSPPSLASPEEDLDDDVFYVDASPAPSCTQEGGVVGGGCPELGVLSQGIPYMDEDNTSLSWLEPNSS